MLTIKKPRKKTNKEQLLELRAIRNRWPIPNTVKQEIIDAAIEIASNKNGIIVDARARVNAIKILTEMEQQNIEQEEKLIEYLEDEIEYQEELESDTEYENATEYNKIAANPNYISDTTISPSKDTPINVNIQTNVVTGFPEGMDIEEKKQYLLDKFNGNN